MLWLVLAVGSTQVKDNKGMKNIVKNWRKWLVAWSFASAMLMGQGSQTTFQTVYEDVSQVGYAVAIPLRQIGQSGHLLNIYFSDAPGQDCTTVTGETMQFFLEGSFDNTNWFVIRYSFYIFGTLDAAGNQATQIDGYGAYPYLRARAVYYAGSGSPLPIFSKCRQNGWYAGSVDGTRQPTDRLLSNQDIYSRYSTTIAAATTTALVSSLGATHEITVWELSVCSAAANAVTFVSTTIPGAALYSLTFSASGGCAVVPYNGIYHLTTEYGDSLSVITTTAASTTINLKVLRQ